MPLRLLPHLGRFEEGNTVEFGVSPHARNVSCDCIGLEDAALFWKRQDGGSAVGKPDLTLPVKAYSTDDTGDGRWGFSQ